MGLFGPSFDELWSGGEASPGTLVGIRRFERSNDETTEEYQDYAVELADGTSVPEREIVLSITYVVVVVSIVAQGLTIGRLLRRSLTTT